MNNYELKMQEARIEANKAFDKAIESGRLSTDKEANNFAGKYMYMGFYAGKDNFKNIITREYDV